MFRDTMSIYSKPKRDITGQVFGKLKVLRMEISSKSKGREYRAICECLICGRTDYDVRPAWLKSFHTKSCGCDKSYFKKQTGNSAEYFAASSPTLCIKHSPSAQNTH